MVRQFVSERYGIGLSRSSCLNWLHRLGFALKRPKKRLLKADAAKREAFVADYAALWDEAYRSGTKIFFADEAHFRADAELRGKWVLRGEPALVDSSSPRYGEKASYYSAVCLETGEVEWMELEGDPRLGPDVCPGGGQRLALGLHQVFGVTANVGGRGRQAQAPVLDAPDGEVIPAGHVGLPGVGRPAERLARASASIAADAAGSMARLRS